MMATTRIAELARTVASGTWALDDYLRLHGLPSPSFAANGPVDFQIASPEIEQARQGAINAALELVDLLQGPAACLRPLGNGLSLQIIYQYDIARKIPLSGEVSFHELSRLCGLHEVDLRRVIRFAIAFHRIFQEPRAGYVAHSAASKLLAEDSVAHAGFGLVCNHIVPSSARTAEAMTRWSDQEPNHTGFNLAHETDQNMFEYMQAKPQVANVYANAMKLFAANIPGNDPKLLLQNYPWDSLGKATIVDMGGSEGTIGALLAEAFPSLKVIVQDLPSVVEAGRTRSPCHITRGVGFEAHDFFDEQKTVADVYFFRWIFHDWPDHLAVKILRNLIPALRDGARIIINDGLSPPPNVLPNSVERSVRWVDLVMLTMHNSRERTAEDWQKLFTEADARFGEVAIKQPPGAALGIIEAIWHADR